MAVHDGFQLPNCLVGRGSEAIPFFACPQFKLRVPRSTSYLEKVDHISGYDEPPVPGSATSFLLKIEEEPIELSVKEEVFVAVEPLGQGATPLAEVQIADYRDVQFFSTLHGSLKDFSVTVLQSSRSGG